MEDPIDLLEKRIAALELQVLPPQVLDVKLTQTSVVDMMIQTNTLIKSALHGRDAVTTILNRMIELNQYLDSNFFENKMNATAKRQFILALYPDIIKYGEKVQKFKTLIPVLDSEHLHNVPSLVPKLQQLTVNNLKMHEESQELSAAVAEALQQYNDIIYSISKMFVQLEDIITRLETDIKKSLTSE